MARQQLPKNPGRRHGHHLKICKPCDKHRYPSQVKAEDVAARRMHLSPGKVIAVYRCPAGNDWHITGSNQVQRIKRQQEASRSAQSPELPAPEPPASR